MLLHAFHYRQTENQNGDWIFFWCKFWQILMCYGLVLPRIRLVLIHLMSIRTDWALRSFKKRLFVMF